MYTFKEWPRIYVSLILLGCNAAYNKNVQYLKHQDQIMQLQFVNCMIKISQELLLAVFCVIKYDSQAAFARNILKWLGRFKSGKGDSQVARKIHQ